MGELNTRGEAPGVRRDHCRSLNSVRRGIRIDSWSALKIGDYVMVGNELLQVEELPKNPDDDIKFRSFRGARMDVRNLALGVIVPDVGLNGILITEDEKSRTFHIEVDPATEPLEQTLYLVARIETNSPNSTEHASQAIRLKVVPKKAQVSQTNN